MAAAIPSAETFPVVPVAKVVEQPETPSVQPDATARATGRENCCLRIFKRARESSECRSGGCKPGASSCAKPVYQRKGFGKTKSLRISSESKALSQREPYERRRSWLVPILGTVLAIAAIGGLVFVVSQFSGGINSGGSSMAKNTEKNEPETRNGSTKDDETKNDRTVDDDPVMNPPDIDEIDNTPIGTQPKKDRTKDDLPRDRKPKDPFGMEGPIKDPSDNPHKVADVLSDFRNNKQRDLIAFQFDMNLIENQWRRCPSVIFENDSESLQLQKFSVQGNRARLIEEAINETTSQLSKFWHQVRNSALETIGGSLTSDGKTVGFVEAGQSGIVLKIAGTNRNYEYQFIPPALIPIIADQGTIDDIPTYRLQKAAFLISNLKRTPGLQREIETLLSLSENDGHDVFHLRLMAELDFWNFSTPGSKVDLNALDESIKALEEQYAFSYGKQVKPVTRRAASRVFRLLALRFCG